MKQLFRVVLVAILVGFVGNICASVGVQLLEDDVTCEKISLIIALTEDSTDQFDNVVFSINLPDNITFLTSSGVTGSVEVVGNSVQWTTGEGPSQNCFITLRASQPGTYSFQVTGVDNDGITHTHPGSPLEVTIEIPETANGVLQTNKDTPITFNIGDFIGSNGTTVTSIQLPIMPMNGSLSAIGAASDFEVTYTPDAGFVGYEVIAYQAFDSGSNTCSNTGVILIAVGTEDATAREIYGEYVRRVYVSDSDIPCPVARFFNVVVTRSENETIIAQLETDLSNAALPVTYSLISSDPSLNATLIDAATGSIQVNGDTLGTYTDGIVYSVTDANGCTSMANIDVEVDLGA